MDGTITAPSGGGYLMFSVNDVATLGFGNRSDNFGSMVVNFAVVPEPSTIVLASIALALCEVCRRVRARAALNSSIAHHP
jgi:hypothetical protein